jgi:hypothetical protein
MQPPPPGQPYGAPAAAGNDRTTLFGWLGIVIGFLCCPLVGIVFGVLSINQAKKNQNSPTLGYVAIALSIVSLIIAIIYQVAFRK